MAYRIVTDQDRVEIEKINAKNVHLKRRVEPVQLENGSWIVSDDILVDVKNWSHWIPVVEKCNIVVLDKEDFKKPSMELE